MLGALAQRVRLVDNSGKCAGGGAISRARLAGHPDQQLGELAENRGLSLKPDDAILQATSLFGGSQCDEPAAVDGRGEIIGVPTEIYVRRRYAPEMIKLRRVSDDFLGSLISCAAER